MRLREYNGESGFSLTADYVDDIPRYAILSHRWGEEEVNFRDLVDGTGKTKAGTTRSDSVENRPNGTACSTFGWTHVA
jgi:hypothetical protein